MAAKYAQPSYIHHRLPHLLVAFSDEAPARNHSNHIKR